MSDESLVRLAEHAEDMAANPNVPPAEKQLWVSIRDEVSAYLGAEQTPEPGLFEDVT